MENVLYKNEINSEQKIDMRGKKELIMFFLLSLYVVLTNCENAILNTLLACFLFAVVLLGKMEMGLCAIIFIAVFFGYSVIELPLIFSGMNIVTVRNIVSLIFAFKVVTNNNFEFFKKVRFVMLLALYMFLIKLVGDSFNAAVNIATMILACWQFIRIRVTDKAVFRIIAKAVVLMTMFTFVYGILHPEVNEEVGGFRFSGVRDSNNFALMCNISLFLIFSDKELFKSKANKALTVIALVIGVLLSISLSGIFTLAVLCTVFGCIFNKKYRALFIVAFLVFALFVFMIVPILANSDAGIFTSISQRLISVFTALEEEDYSAATTTRTDVWETYMSMFDKFSQGEKLFGNQTVIREWMAESEKNIASHNYYIDTLLSFGILGLSVLLLLISYSVINSIRYKNYKQLIICVLLAANLVFRSMENVLVMSMMLCCQTSKDKGTDYL